MNVEIKPIDSSAVEAKRLHCFEPLAEMLLHYTIDGTTEYTTTQQVPYDGDCVGNINQETKVQLTQYVDPKTERPIDTRIKFPELCDQCTQWGECLRIFNQRLFVNKRTEKGVGIRPIDPNIVETKSLHCFEPLADILLHCTIADPNGSKEELTTAQQVPHDGNCVGNISLETKVQLTECIDSNTGRSIYTRINFPELCDKCAESGKCFHISDQRQFVNKGLNKEI